jgi:hypothetical protein
VRSYTLLWKLQKCTRVGRRLLSLTSLLTVETLNVFGFWSWSFIIHCVSLIHLSCTLLLLTMCFVIRCICETRVGEVIFPCRLSTIVVFIRLLICHYSSTPLVYTKSPNFVSSSLSFLLEGVLCKWGKTLKRLRSQLYHLLFKPKTLNYHILLVVVEWCTPKSLVEPTWGSKCWVAENWGLEGCSRLPALRRGRGAC